MDKKEARKIMKENFEEINCDNFNDLQDCGETSIFCNDGTLYFKPKQKFPIVFEDKSRKIEIDEHGIEITDLTDKDVFINFGRDVSLPLLIKAVDKWKELNNGN